MENLITFPQKPTNDTPRSKEPVLIEADLQFKESDVYLEFGFLGQQELFDLPKTAATWTESQVPRQNGLWHATCFEAFLNPVGSSNYYEFNFALIPAWNAYRFDDYLQPQPETPTTEFALKSMSWDPLKSRLLIEVQNKSPFTKFRVGLTAILLEKSGVKHFCALTHKNSKPDFHKSESFILQRGSEL